MEADPLEARYANYLQIGSTDEEFVFEFGQAYESEQDPVIHTRLVATVSSAREFLRLLERSIQDFERHRSQREVR
jgi:hypothetical protein